MRHLALLLLATPAAAAPCGGDWHDFIAAMTAEAVAAGVPADQATAFFAGARPDARVLKADRAQGVFGRPFTDFARRLISADRLERGRALAARHAATFARAEAEYGVPRGILLAFWAFETDYGAVQGDFDTRNALLTLGHDCRRPQLFQPQVIAAARLHAEGRLPLDTQGAWAGEIGMVQMLPADILRLGRDGDGDGQVSLKTSPEDALLSGAALLQSHGWRPGEPWLQEVILPDTLDWSLSGTATARDDWAALGLRAREGQIANLPASLLLPQGHRGPAFLAYPNFKVLFDWNQSLVYVTTAAYFATRLEGAPVFDPRDPEPGLDQDRMRRLQEKLAARGHDVGKRDGILGAATRSAVQKEQSRLGLPADGWPTAALLDAL
jgi:lytic murein transglycosylase